MSEPQPQPTKSRHFELFNLICGCTLSVNEKIVLYTLLAHDNDDGRCHPGHKRIAREAGIGHSTARKAVYFLRKAKIIKVDSRSRPGSTADSSNRYTFSVESLQKIQYSPGCSVGTPPMLPQNTPPCSDRTPPVFPQNTQEQTNEQTSIEQPKEQEQAHRNGRAATKGKRFQFDATDRETAGWIFGLIQAVNPGHRKPNLDAWADEIRRMRERDGRTDDEIRDLFGWANGNDFWQANILCPQKLRKQWDQLTIKREAERNGRKQSADTGGGFLWKPGEKYGG